MKVTLRQAMETPGMAGAIMTGNVQTKLFKASGGLANKVLLDSLVAIAALIIGIVVLIKVIGLLFSLGPSMDSALTAHAVMALIMGILLVLSTVLIGAGFVVAMAEGPRKLELFIASKLDEEVEL